MSRSRASRRPRSVRRLALDFTIFLSVVVALPFLVLARIASRRSPR